MVKCRACPRRRGVARCARRWKTGGNVIWVGCSGEVGFVAGIAIRRHGRVIAIRMATGAGYRQMRPGERKCSLGVVEARRTPGRCRVANGAIGREPG